MNDNWFEIIFILTYRLSMLPIGTNLPICIMCYSTFEFILDLKKEEVIFSIIIIIIKENMFSLFRKRRSQQRNAIRSPQALQSLFRKITSRVVQFCNMNVQNKK